MIFNLPYIHLPQHFIDVLSMPHNETGRDNTRVFDLLSLNKALMINLERCFRHVENVRDVRDIISVLGWRNFRDHLASFYIYHNSFRKFPTLIDKSNTQMSKEFEERFDFISQKSNSRLFMLGFYFRMMQTTN